jgi:hypothetical protein
MCIHEERFTITDLRHSREKTSQVEMEMEMDRHMVPVCNLFVDAGFLGCARSIRP